MQTDITITAQECAELEGLVVNCNTPAKVGWRAEIVLASAAGASVKAVWTKECLRIASWISVGRPPS